MSRLLTTFFVCSGLAIGGSGDAGAKLTMKVSPAMSPAPALVTVQAIVEPADENRELEITAESATYLRRSRIPLNGKDAPRVNVVELRDLPTGLYEVRGVLVGLAGPIATALRIVRVEPSPGVSR